MSQTQTEPKPNPNHDLAYTTKIKPLRQFTILFLLGFGAIGLLFFIPIALLFGYMIIDGGHVVLYIAGIGFLPFLIGAGVYVGRLFYQEWKRRIVDNRYPSGYDLLDNHLAFQVFNIEDNKYTYGNIPYDTIETCVFSMFGEPVFRSNVGAQGIRIAWYEYQAVAHIIYWENGTRALYSTRSTDKTTHTHLFETLQQHHVQLEIVPYELERVPGEMLLDVIQDDLKKHPIHNEADLEPYIIYDKPYEEPPQVYTNAYTKWLVEKRGLVQTALQPWHALAATIILNLLVAMGLTQAQPGFFAIVVAPYLATGVGYVFYIYTLKRPTYRKTLIPFGLTLGVYIAILQLTGHEPFTFYTEPGAMTTLANPTSEAVIGTVIGFFAGSYMLYLVAKEAVRERFPAAFHEEIATIMRNTKA